MSSTAALRSLTTVGAERAQRRDDFVDQSGRRGRPAVTPMVRAPASQRRSTSPTPSTRWCRVPLRAPRPDGPSWRSSASRPPAPRPPRQRPSARPAAGWWWRSRCRPRRARPAPGSAAAAPADPVGLVHRERGLHQVRHPLRVVDLDPVGGGDVGHQPGRSGASPSVPSTSSCPSCPISSTVSPRRRSGGPRRAPWSPAGRSRR